MLKLRNGYWKSKEVENKRKVEATIARLISEYNYKCVRLEVAEKAQQYYLNTIPRRFTTSSEPIYTINGTLVARGWDEIITGDYGSFIEISPQDMIIENLIIPHDQAYRIEEKQYSDNIKYLWYSINDGSKIKIYFQKKTVPYADYKPGFYYISVFEAFVLSNFMED